MNSSEHQIKTVKNEKSEKLGQWFYDKKSKKKRYLSANGKLSTGKQASLQAKIDKDEEIKYHQRQTRQELQLNVRNSIERLSSDYENLSKFITYDDAKLETWGIPYKTVQRYYSKGFKSLFPWQIHCLRIDNNSVLLGRNLVFSAPTSGGKTMVSEILMLRRLGQLRGTILFVVPYVALVEEKSEYFRNMWIDMGICVKAFHGGESGTDLTPETDVAVCTIERANIL
jgi:superfamily II helicase